jgi:hypothetical protein
METFKTILLFILLIVAIIMFAYRAVTLQKKYTNTNQVIKNTIAEAEEKIFNQAYTLGYRQATDDIRKAVKAEKKVDADEFINQIWDTPFLDRYGGEVEANVKEINARDLTEN